MLPSPYGCRLGPRGYSLSRPQCVHCCYGPVTRGLPRGGLVDRLQSFSFHHLCYPNYGALTLTPAGLSPAEHASLRWTHNRPRVSQAFCSALPVAYSQVPSPHWELFGSLVLEAAYEATLWAAVINAQRGVSNVVFLTLLGGGAFGNPS